MPEKLLNRSQIYSLPKQMRCKTMPQQMRINFFFHTRFFSRLFNYGLNSRSCESAATIRRKQNFVTRKIAVAFQFFLKTLRQLHKSVFLALCKSHMNQRLFKINISPTLKEKLKLTRGFFSPARASLRSVKQQQIKRYFPAKFPQIRLWRTSLNRDVIRKFRELAFQKIFKEG